MRGTRCLRFRSDPERTCKWTVCLTSDFILCDWYRLHRMACLCGMLRCKWSRLLLKSKVLWWWSKHGLCGVALCNVCFASFTPGMNQKRETDLREGMRFLLAKKWRQWFYTPWRVWLMWLLLLRGASVRSDDPGPMESFVGSLTPQRVGKRSVQAF